MGNLTERIINSDRFKNTASVLPILMGLIPRNNRVYFDLRQSIVATIKTRAVEIYKKGKHRRGDLLMARAQDQETRLNKDRDYVENYAERVRFAQAPVKKIEVVESPKVKREEVISAEDRAFRKMMERAEQEILIRINKGKKR